MNNRSPTSNQITFKPLLYGVQASFVGIYILALSPPWPTPKHRAFGQYDDYGDI
jgi:hypothetical protein